MAPNNSVTCLPVYILGTKRKTCRFLCRCGKGKKEIEMVTLEKAPNLIQAVALLHEGRAGPTPPVWGKTHPLCAAPHDPPSTGLLVPAPQSPLLRPLHPEPLPPAVGKTPVGRSPQGSESKRREPSRPSKSPTSQRVMPPVS